MFRQSFKILNKANYFAFTDWWQKTNGIVNVIFFQKSLVSSLFYEWR